MSNLTDFFEMGWFNHQLVLFGGLLLIRFLGPVGIDEKKSFDSFQVVQSIFVCFTFFLSHNHEANMTKTCEGYRGSLNYPFGENQTMQM